MNRAVFLSSLALVALLANARAPEPRRMEPAVACPQGAEAMIRLELIFGANRKERAPVGENEWQAFLESEVVPRFPDGFTVLTGAGQWRGASGETVREQSRLLLVWAPPGRNAEAESEAIRAAYKKRFAQESVLRAGGVSCVSF